MSSAVPITLASTVLAGKTMSASAVVVAVATMLLTKVMFNPAKAVDVAVAILEALTPFDAIALALLCASARASAFNMFIKNALASVKAVAKTEETKVIFNPAIAEDVAMAVPKAFILRLICALESVLATASA